MLVVLCSSGDIVGVVVLVLLLMLLMVQVCEKLFAQYPPAFHSPAFHRNRLNINM